MTTPLKTCEYMAELAKLPDDEFWARVYSQDELPNWDQYYDPPDELERIVDPCPVCGADGACGYDNEGRAMIHTRPDWMDS